MNRISRPAVLASCALVLAACEGPNLFTGPAPAGGDNDPPRVVALLLPDDVRPGEVLEVDIEAAASEGISAMDVTVIEAVTRERTLTVDPPQTSVRRITDFTLSPTLTRASVTVRVQVQDRLGARSEAVEVNVPVVQSGSGF